MSRKQQNIWFFPALLEVRQLRMRKLWLGDRGTPITYYNRGIVIFILIVSILNILIIVKTHNTHNIIVNNK